LLTPAGFSIAAGNFIKKSHKNFSTPKFFGNTCIAAPAASNSFGPKNSMLENNSDLQEN
jgi:hypothetical protein